MEVGEVRWERTLGRFLFSFTSAEAEGFGGRGAAIGGAEVEERSTEASADVALPAEAGLEDSSAEGEETMCRRHKWIPLLINAEERQLAIVLPFAAFEGGQLMKCKLVKLKIEGANTFERALNMKRTSEELRNEWK